MTTKVKKPIPINNQRKQKRNSSRGRKNLARQSRTFYQQNSLCIQNLSQSLWNGIRRVQINTQKKITSLIYKRETCVQISKIRRITVTPTHWHKHSNKHKPKLSNMVFCQRNVTVKENRYRRIKLERRCSK